MTTTEQEFFAKTSFVEFSSKIKGQVTTPQQAELFQKQKLIWNGMYNYRNPRLIVRCATEEDVSECLKYIQRHGVKNVCVRSGGHSISGASLIEDGFVIDLSLMRKVEVDPVPRTVRVQAGCLLGDVDRETAKHNLAIVSGLASHTGITGLTLGGGIGWLSRSYGLAADNVLSFRVVSPIDGSVITATATNEHKDLFWALKGSGHQKFGVVTQIEFQAHPISNMYFGYFLYDLSFKAVKTYFEKVITKCKENMAVYAFLEKPYLCLIMVAHFHFEETDNVEREKATEEIIAVLDELAMMNPLQTKIEPEMKYVDLQKHFDEGVPHEKWYYWKSVISNKTPTDQAIQALLNVLDEAPSCNQSGLRNSAEIMHLGGRMAEIDEQTASYQNRKALFEIHTISSWEGHLLKKNQNETITSQVKTWTRSFANQMQETGLEVSGYANFKTQEDSSTNRVLSSTEEAHIQRLQQVKTSYNPNSVV